MKSIRDNEYELMSALYLQVSIISQALIFVTRSRSWSFIERPGLLLLTAFFIAQLVSLFDSNLICYSLFFFIKFENSNDLYYVKIATLIAVYANWDFARVHGIGWGWAGVIWLYSIVFYFPLDVFKFIIRFALSGKAWDNMLQNKASCFINYNSLTIFL